MAGRKSRLRAEEAGPAAVPGTPERCSGVASRPGRGMGGTPRSARLAWPARLFNPRYSAEV